MGVADEGLSDGDQRESQIRDWFAKPESRELLHDAIADGGYGSLSPTSLWI